MSPSPSRGEGGGFQAPACHSSSVTAWRGMSPNPESPWHHGNCTHMGRARHAPFHLFTWPCSREVVHRHNALRFLSSHPQTSR